MKKKSSLLFAIILVLTASSLVQTVHSETDQLNAREIEDYGILETVTVPISGTLTAGDPIDIYGTWDGGVDKIIVQISWTPSGEPIRVGFYDVTHSTLYYTNYLYGGYAYVTFFVPAGHPNCKWQVWIWGPELTGQDTIQYHGYIYIIWE